MSAAPLRAYAAVTAAYWSFMLTDGALRMLVLLHFHTLGFSPVQLAYLFVLYEVAGIVTNLGAGWIAARFGLALTLYVGLGLQILALLVLSQQDPLWAITFSVVYVMAAQGLSGVAKDFTKMSAKSAVKLLAPDGLDGLFRWVALLTGSKNAIKGVGFFLGAVLLGAVGFQMALVGMAGALALVLGLVAATLPRGLPAGRKGAKFTEVWSRNPRINRLSLARVFLFGARDVWFVVGIPIFFYSVLSDGSAAGNRAAFFQIGGFMALWVIFYGVVQSQAPRLWGKDTLSKDRLSRDAATWAAALVPIPLALAILVFVAAPETPWLAGVVAAGLFAFAAVFAVNSALHSLLILAFSGGDRVTMDVGFYYMANAAGRLAGTLLSGLSYQLGGLPLVLASAAAMLLVSFITTRDLAALSR